jgi:hypothetical protein
MHTAVGSPRDEEEGVRKIDALECNHDTATVGPGPSKIGAGIDVTPIAEDAVYQEKHTTLVEIGYGRNLNEKLFNIASGKVQDVWCKFKRFDRLSLLNLCHYQDKLVELEGKIQKDPSNMTKEQIKELAELLREYRKYRCEENPSGARETMFADQGPKTQPSRRSKTYGKCRDPSPVPRKRSSTGSVR